MTHEGGFAQEREVLSSFQILVERSVQTLRRRYILNVR